MTSAEQDQPPNSTTTKVNLKRLAEKKGEPIFKVRCDEFIREITGGIDYTALHIVAKNATDDIILYPVAKQAAWRWLDQNSPERGISPRLTGSRRIEERILSFINIADVAVFISPYRREAGIAELKKAVEDITRISIKFKGELVAQRPEALSPDLEEEIVSLAYIF